MPARMRFVADAYRELKRLDPNTAYSLNYVRNLVRTGLVPSVSVGRRRLVNLDALLDALDHPERLQLPVAHTAAHGIRRVGDVRT